MNLLESFTNSTERDIIISLPKDKTWLEYLACFMKLKQGSQLLELIFETLPKTQVGRKCYFIYDSTLRGHMNIEKVAETIDNQFSISLEPYFFFVQHKVHMNEIENEEFKYYFDNSSTQ